MKVYPFGSEDAPAILLLPGTCCHWKGNFGHVIPLLAANYHVLCVSYDGFDETEQSEFPTMLEETEKIETYIQENCGGHIRAAYGCSLGGSFVGLLAARQNIQMDYGILGISDLDQASAFAAKLLVNLAMSLIYPMIRDGKMKGRFLQKRMEKREQQMPEYTTASCVMSTPKSVPTTFCWRKPTRSSSTLSLTATGLPRAVRTPLRGCSVLAPA